mgnify:CR=1 FL=1
MAEEQGQVPPLPGARELARFAEMRHQTLLPIIMPIVLVATFQATRSWGDLYFLLSFGIVGWIMKRFAWPRPPMVLGFVLGPIFERYLFLSNEIYGNAWMLRPVVIVIAILIAWALYRPLKETVAKLAHEFRHLSRAHLKLSPRAWFTIAFIAFIIGAIAAFVVVFGIDLLEYLRIDDPIGAGRDPRVMAHHDHAVASDAAVKLQCGDADRKCARERGQCVLGYEAAGAAVSSSTRTKSFASPSGVRSGGA